MIGPTRHSGPAAGWHRARHALSPLILALLAMGADARIDIDFPTDNTALCDGQPHAFYQHVDRTFEGTRSTPWEGGQFGFVRDPVRSGSSVIFRKFHEGIDIRPMHRAPDGEPQDLVRVIGEGEVVYVNPTSGASNYGRYVVVKHCWDGCDYFSLYAHLAGTTVTVGEKVAKGAPLGRMGYSGAGIDRERAHLHLEIGLLVNLAFQEWYDETFKSDPNRNGLYNGMNLIGLDSARLLLEARSNPSLTLPEFLRKEKTAFRIALPVLPPLAKRYPWLVRERPAAGPAPAWEISFNAYGLPLAAAPLREPVVSPRVTFLIPSPHRTSWVTRNLLSGTVASPRLTPSGERFLALLMRHETTGGSLPPSAGN